MGEPGRVAEASAASALTLTAKGAGVEFEVFAKPSAKKSAVRGLRDGALEVAVAAPPKEGEANEELVRFLAEALGVPRRDVTLVRGASARRKRVCVVGLSLEQLRARLAHAC